MKVNLVIEIRHNIISSSLFGSNMKEIDDTPLPETESELTDEEIQRAIRFLIKRVGSIDKWIHSEIPKISRLTNQVANLETQRTPQDENDDPEWY